MPFLHITYVHLCYHCTFRSVPDLIDLAGQDAVAYIYPELRLHVGAVVCLMPDRTKTGAKDGPMSVMIKKDALCSISWLVRLLALCDAAGLPVTNYLTRPQSKDKKSFLEQGLGSTVVANRVKQHLSDAKLYRGQTVHGSRRGSMQHAVHVLGQSQEEVAKAAQIRTPAITQRYLDPFRHCK